MLTTYQPWYHGKYSVERIFEIAFFLRDLQLNMSKAEVRSPCAYLWGDLSAIQNVGKIRAYNIHKMQIFAFVLIFIYNAFSI